MTHAERIKQHELDEERREARAIGCFCFEDNYLAAECPLHCAVQEQDEEDEEVTEIRPVDMLLLEVCALRPRATVRAMHAVEDP